MTTKRIGEKVEEATVIGPWESLYYKLDDHLDQIDSKIKSINRLLIIGTILLSMELLILFWL